MKQKLWIGSILVTLLVLSACAPAGTGAPTPTIIPLNRPGKGLSQLPTATATPTASLPTATPIPFPSSTPTPSPTAPAVTPTAIASPTPTATATRAAPRAEVISTGLNIRQGPGIDYPVVGSAGAGDRFEVIGRNAAGAWLQVPTSAGETAWISGKPDYTRVLGSLENVPVVEAPTPAGREESAAAPAPANRKSGAGGRLIFTTSSGGDLYAVDADGSNLRHLTGGVIDPALSPDGQQVAFTRWDGAEFGALYVLNLEDGNERAILGETRQAKSPAWSPDGKEIVVSFQHGGLLDPEEECRSFDADDGIRIPQRAEITKSHFNKVSGILTICFIRKENLQWSLRRVNVQTGEFEDLPVDLYSYNPAWDPNNPWRVVYDGEKGLLQLDLNTGEQWALTDDLRDTGPVFSPSGKKLALTYKQHDHWEVYTLDLETGERSRLTKPPILADPQYNSASPAWSPDGSKIAFLTDRTGRWEIWVMNADGSRQQPLFPPEIQSELDLQYNGVSEQMLNWAG